MSKILFLFFGLVSYLFAPPQWKTQKFLELPKDEFYLLDLKAGENTKTLYFRWTLLKNGGLVMHLNYDHFPHQFVLYQDYQKNCYTVPLLSAEEKDHMQEPFFMLCFKDYHRSKKIATLKYYIYEGGRDFNITNERMVSNGSFRAN
ncbi:MAG: hypothetical protein K2I63_00475 [Helicobacter sp.]|nr:hypothetical protein [Helicobacter sp.]